MQVDDPSLYSYYASDPSSSPHTGLSIPNSSFTSLPDEMKRSFDASAASPDTSLDPSPTAGSKKARYGNPASASASGLYALIGQQPQANGSSPGSQQGQQQQQQQQQALNPYGQYGMYGGGMYNGQSGGMNAYANGMSAGVYGSSGVQANGLTAQATLGVGLGAGANGGYGGLGVGTPQGIAGGQQRAMSSAYPGGNVAQYGFGSQGGYGAQGGQGGAPLYTQAAGIAYPGAAGGYAFGQPNPMLANHQAGFSGLPGGMGMMNGGQYGGRGPMAGMGVGYDPSSALSTLNQRTVYVGNLPADAAVDELLNQVRFGPLDNVKILPEKNCAFISFLSPDTAAAFHSDAVMRKVSLHGQDLKIGWGKPSSVAPTIQQAVQTRNATRNVYVGNLDETVSEQSLRDDLARFGPIDQVKIVRDKNIGFVHFLSIATAVKVVETLAQEPAWAGRRVAFGKDRCAYVPKNQHQQQQHNQAAAAMAAQAANFAAQASFGMGMGMGVGMGGMGMGLGGMGMGMEPGLAPGNRTCYLGNIHPETTTEEICNTIRGGILQQIKYMPDKHIAFVTFVDPNAALAFFHSASVQGIALHNRRLKIGWGKHSGPVSPGIAMVVQSGGSRNVYVGSIQDFDLYNEEKLRNDFSQYGDVELVNTLPEKNCAFVNFQSISSAIKAIEGIKQHADYQGLKIAYGKDRCGNPPRSVGFGQGAYGSRNRHQNAMAQQNAVDAMAVQNVIGEGYDEQDGESESVPAGGTPEPLVKEDNVV